MWPTLNEDLKLIGWLAHVQIKSSVATNWENEGTWRILELWLAHSTVDFILIRCHWMQQLARHISRVKYGISAPPVICFSLLLLSFFLSFFFYWYWAVSRRRHQDGFSFFDWLMTAISSWLDWSFSHFPQLILRPTAENANVEMKLNPQSHRVRRCWVRSGPDGLTPFEHYHFILFYFLFLRAQIECIVVAFGDSSLSKGISYRHLIPVASSSSTSSSSLQPFNAHCIYTAHTRTVVHCPTIFFF